jgi:hypothetical protein
MFRGPFNRIKPATRAPEHPHRFDGLTDFCTQCGVHRSSVWLDEWPLTCPAGSNVVGISHLLALRHLATTAQKAPTLSSLWL